MKKLYVLPLLLLAVVACKNGGEQKAEDSNEKVAKVFAEEMALVRQDLRKPGVVSDLLFLAGTDFMPELINDPMNYEVYQNNPLHAAANIGVYSIDALYQIAFDKPYEGYLSIAASKQLAISLGIGEIMDKIILDRYDDGEYPADSVLNTIRETIFKSENVLKQKEQADIFAAILVGNYIEKLYILFSNVFDYPVDLPDEAKMLILRDILIITSNELELLPSAIALVEDLTKQNETPYLLIELKELQALRVEHSLSDAEFEKLKPELIFDNEGLKMMYEKVKAARSVIVATK